MTERKRILVSWVGHADLLALASESSDAQRQRVCKAIGKPVPRDVGVGPIKTVVANCDFGEVHLIADGPDWLLKAYVKWLDGRAKMHTVKLPDPTDYAAVFHAADKVLAKAARPDTDLWIALSSGTPAMAATLVLLGKSRYPARFLQTYRGKTNETEIPFDLTVDYVPELLQDPDAKLQLLADKSPAEVEGFDAIVGDSQPIRLAVGRAKRAAVRDVSVLLLGESGVGKELFAQAIHSASARRDGPFVAVNCAAMPKDLLESILFGHKKGAFTGATADHAGAFEEADGGTLFLDEFGECDPDMQAKLLRVLQPGPKDPPCRRTFRRVGDTKDRLADVRIVAATNRDPQIEISEGRLREDLFYRIATITLRIPALRDRRSDLPKIADTLLTRINAEFEKGEPGYTHKQLSAAAKRFMAQQPWPGNVRQLNNTLVQAAVMCTSNTIGKPDLEAAMSDLSGTAGSANPLERALGDGFDLQGHLEDIHRHFLRRAMEEAEGVKTKAAELLGLKSYQTLDAQLKRLGVDSCCEASRCGTYLASIHCRRQYKEQ